MVNRPPCARCSRGSCRLRHSRACQAWRTQGSRSYRGPESALGTQLDHRLHRDVGFFVSGEGHSRPPEARRHPLRRRPGPARHAHSCLATGAARRLRRGAWTSVWRGLDLDNSLTPINLQPEKIDAGAIEAAGQGDSGALITFAGTTRPNMCWLRSRSRIPSRATCCNAGRTGCGRSIRTGPLLSDR